jgi:DNA (cytosine-5)-methyltransferase 1
MKVGSLCTGYGGLDLAVEAYFNAEMVWCAENDKYAFKVIEARFNKPNLNDIKTINWDEVEPIDILTAGYPCQPFSHAGQRKGKEDERHLWPYIIKAISKLRPKYVILENVRGHLSLGFKEVLGDLAQNGYDAKWRIIRASDVGAPHQRARLFIIAYANSDACQESRRAYREIPTESTGFQRWQDIGQARCEHGCSCEINCNPDNQYQSHYRQVSKLGGRFITRREMSMQTSPNTLVDGKLNAKFVEYMMGLPDGWVTDLDLSRAQQLKMLGNGVVPQQAYYALELLHE